MSYLINGYGGPDPAFVSKSQIDPYIFPSYGDILQPPQSFLLLSTDAYK